MNICITQEYQFVFRIDKIVGGVHSAPFKGGDGTGLTGEAFFGDQLETKAELIPPVPYIKFPNLVPGHQLDGKRT